MNRLIPTRWSHLLSFSGVGALVRADEDLYVIKDIGHWTTRDGSPAGEIIGYVDLLRATLGIDRELRQPPLARELAKGRIDGTCVPALRFPRWTRCPNCGLLHWRPWPYDQKLAAADQPTEVFVRAPFAVATSHLGRRPPGGWIARCAMAFFGASRRRRWTQLRRRP